MSERKKLSREEIAKIEIGHTEINHTAGWILIVGFLCFIFGYLIWQSVFEIRKSGAGEMQVLKLGEYLKGLRFTELNKGIKAYERNLEDVSLLRMGLLERVQRLMSKYLDFGNEKVIVGQDGYLFYTAGYNYLAHPGFLLPEKLHKKKLAGVQGDPVKAITAFDKYLKNRNIRLILLPVTVKPMLYSDKLGAGTEIVLRQNPSYNQFLQQMKTAGVEVFEPGEILLEQRKNGIEVFLKTDTHWTPAGMEAVAAALASTVKGGKIDKAEHGIADKKAGIEVENIGDIAAMLKLCDPGEFFPKEKVMIFPVADFRSSPEAEILLMGDSFCNIYSAGVMNWGGKAGLAERLSAYLQSSVDVIARNDAGAYATREILARDLKRGRDRLKGKKVVVWEFAVRELSEGDWKDIEFVKSDATVSTAESTGKINPVQRIFILPENGNILTLTCTAAAVSDKVKPGSVPYKDHIMSVHFKADDGREALVYLLSMKDNVLQPASNVQTGDKLKLKLWNFEAFESRYGALNRSEIADEEVALQNPCWGEIVK